jgi:hypothetical protein
MESNFMSISLAFESVFFSYFYGYVIHAAVSRFGTLAVFVESFDPTTTTHLSCGVDIVWQGDDIIAASEWTRARVERDGIPSVDSCRMAIDRLKQATAYGPDLCSIAGERALKAIPADCFEGEFVHGADGKPLAFVMVESNRDTVRKAMVESFDDSDDQLEHGRFVREAMA